MVGFIQFARRKIEQSITVKQSVLADGRLLEALEEIARAAFQTLEAGGKVLLFGNGGSAADAQHIAAELVGRYKQERRGLPAIALTVDTSCLTAVANDYGYEYVFARQIEALGRSGDLAIGISTSGNSPNVLRGMEAARTKGLTTVGLTGRNGGKLKESVDHCIQVQSDETPRIQEVHILVGHILCEFVEGEMFGGTEWNREEWSSPQLVRAVPANAGPESDR
jgi:D-sedoheptulose 7-phosphate isomerase